ncbi:hypothetical protein TEA_027904 [Camellia sinensis var. sinensis]|uniref:Aminoalcoholphosphotransferase n=1 Tax=Camellia sinensis var. sinensis TaxID=542762 RepID=A0A4S4DKT7_CAMSN|nr:hypothetical protein TEA_027904 [Camellia sinensis var. sinensis]
MASVLVSNGDFSAAKSPALSTSHVASVYSEVASLIFSAMLLFQFSLPGLVWLLVLLMEIDTQSLLDYDLNSKPPFTNGSVSEKWYRLSLPPLGCLLVTRVGEEDDDDDELRWNLERPLKGETGKTEKEKEITLTGFMFLVISALLGYIYSPKLDSPPPRWVHFAHGLLLFLYQQARRTNSSSPLGELFDHGCDALACAFEALAFGSTAMCGRTTFWFWVISAVPFYCATWEHYFTNTLILPAINGPTEGLMLIYLVHFFTAIVGAEWWAQQFGKSLPFLSWVPVVNEIPTNRATLVLMIAFAVLPTISFNVYNVYKVVQARKGSMLLALAMLYPFAVLLVGVVVWDYLSPYDITGNYPHLVIVGTGLAFGFLVSLLYLPFAIANSLTAWLNDGIPLVDERWVLLLYVAYTVALYLHFATTVIHEITAALGIYCFRSFLSSNGMDRDGIGLILEMPV